MIRFVKMTINLPRKFVGKEFADQIEKKLK